MTKDLKDRITEEWAMLDPVDPLRKLLSDVIDVLTQPAQEPVGEVNRYGRDSHGRQWHGIHWYDANVDVPHGTKLYTTPQPRPWVGLTDEDAQIAALKVPLKDRIAFDAGMSAAAKILKEKNT